MSKIKLRLEYKCFPMWVYDENDSLINNDLVDELKNNDTIDFLLKSIQEDFDNLFINDGREFRYEGFRDNNAKKSFQKKVQDAYSIIKNRVGEDYIIESFIDINEL
ncbi:MAG TPA: hypothetical protein VK071_04240 [Tissierellales bacterium]|nr:hypothetical protein [Tissierellales bacterium]